MAARLSAHVAPRCTVDKDGAEVANQALVELLVVVLDGVSDLLVERN
jgi:hypothetical protein